MTARGSWPDDLLNAGRGRRVAQKGIPTAFETLAFLAPAHPLLGKAPARDRRPRAPAKPLAKILENGSKYLVWLAVVVVEAQLQGEGRVPRSSRSKFQRVCNARRSSSPAPPGRIGGAGYVTQTPARPAPNAPSASCSTPSPVRAGNDETITSYTRYSIMSFSGAPELFRSALNFPGAWGAARQGAPFRFHGQGEGASWSRMRRPRASFELGAGSSNPEARRRLRDRPGFPSGPGLDRHAAWLHAARGPGDRRCHRSMCPPRQPLTIFPSWRPAFWETTNRTIDAVQTDEGDKDRPWCRN